jgi:hypothetical protein
MKKGIFEFEVGDPKVKHGFKFGTLALGIAEREEDTTLDQVFKRAGFEEGGTPSVMTLLNIFYGAAIQYAEDKNLTVDFKKSTVSDWLDELGLDKVYQILADGMEPYVEKKRITNLSPEAVSPTPSQTLSTTP